MTTEQRTPTAADYKLAERIWSDEKLGVNLLYESDAFVSRVAQMLADSRTPEERHAGRLIELCAGLLDYRKRNTSNFQLEKLDDYLNRIRDLLYSIERERAEAEEVEA